MDFSIAEPLMLKYGISPEQIDELKVLAAKLPSDVIDGSRMPLPHIPGLSAFESEVLMMRMLDAIAPTFGVVVEGGELCDIAGYPGMLELMTKADRHSRAHLRNNNAITVEERKTFTEVDAAGLPEKKHLHA